MSLAALGKTRPGNHPGQRQHNKRCCQRGRDRQQRGGQTGGAELHEGEDRQRVGVIGQDDGGAELPECS